MKGCGNLIRSEQAIRIGPTLALGTVHAVVLGKNASGAAEQLKAYPVDTIHVTEDPDIDAFFIDPSVDYLEAAAKAVGPALILVPYTMIGRDLGSRLAARLDAGQTADVIDIKIDGLGGHAARCG